MRLVVIGGVAAGMSAATRARRLDPSLEILVLEKGPVVSYGACGLPYLLSGLVKRAEQLVVHTPEYFHKERNIEVRTGATVASIAHPRRELLLAGGERVRYDRLIVATGARPAHIQESPRAFPLHTLTGAVKLTSFLAERKPRTAAVIGGGYIGIEAAEALRWHGLAVTLYEAGEDLLHRDDPELTARIERHLQRCRIAVHRKTRVQSIDDLREDVVLVAAGLQPNVDLALEAGVQAGRTGAIAADDRMQTNVPGIWAAGDCAESMHQVTGRPTWIPLGTTANKMGRVAGANAAGRRERFPGIVGTSIVGVCGMGVATTGLSEAQARREGFSPASARIDSQSKPGYFRGRPVMVELVADRGTGRLLGGTVIGEHDVAGRINVIATALHSKMNVEEFAQMDLAYAPPFAPVWDPLLIAAQQLLKM
jgi:NADPH-dependent 2,4-dienoyl-CoA reductase/sulfur reductase-like enzyme